MATEAPTKKRRVHRAARPEGNVHKVVEISDEEASGPAPLVARPRQPRVHQSSAQVSAPTAVSNQPAKPELEHGTKRKRRRKHRAVAAAEHAGSTTAPAAPAAPASEHAADGTVGPSSSSKTGFDEGNESASAKAHVTAPGADAKTALGARLLATQKEVLRLRLQAKSLELDKLRSTLRYKTLAKKAPAAPPVSSAALASLSVDATTQDSKPVVGIPEVTTASSNAAPVIAAAMALAPVKQQGAQQQIPPQPSAAKKMLQGSLKRLLANHTEKIRQMKELMEKRKHEVMATSGASSSLIGSAAHSSHAKKHLPTPGLSDADAAAAPARTLAAALAARAASSAPITDAFRTSMGGVGRSRTPAVSKPVSSRATAGDANVAAAASAAAEPSSGSDDVSDDYSESDSSFLGSGMQ